MANEDVLERFGWDGEEGLIFDRTKPFGDSTPDKGPLYEEVTTFDLIEIANALAAALREARKDRERLKALAKYVRDGGSVHGEDMAWNLTDPGDASELAAIWYGRPADFYENRIERVTIEALADALLAETGEK